jgi:hypothetical protein
MSSGPRTQEGKARLIAAVKLRWQNQREKIVADIKAGLAKKKAAAGYITRPKRNEK